MASKVAALLLLCLVCFQLATAQMVRDCCLSVSEKRLNPKNLLSYRNQVAGMGCDISATVFVNKKGLKLCMVPAEENAWVQHLIKVLDKRRHH